MEGKEWKRGELYMYTDCSTIHAAHTAGKAIFVSNNKVWIVDTGATNHMVSENVF